MGQAHSGHTAARALTTEGGGAAIDPLLADYSPALHAGGGSRHRSRLSVQWSLNHRKKKQKQKPSPPTPLASRVEQPQSTAPDASGVGIQPKKNLKAASAAAAAAATAEEITLFVSAPTPPPPGSLRLAHSTHAASPPPRFHLTSSEASVAKVLSPCQPQPPQHHGEDTKENTTIQKISSNPVKEAELVVEEGKADELGDGTYGRLKSCFKPGSLGPPMHFRTDRDFDKLESRWKKKRRRKQKRKVRVKWESNLVANYIEYLAADWDEKGSGSADDAKGEAANVNVDGHVDRGGGGSGGNNADDSTSNAKAATATATWVARVMGVAQADAFAHQQTGHVLLRASDCRRIGVSKHFQGYPSALLQHVVDHDCSISSYENRFGSAAWQPTWKQYAVMSDELEEAEISLAAHHGDERRDEAGVAASTLVAPPPPPPPLSLSKSKSKSKSNLAAPPSLVGGYVVPPRSANVNNGFQKRFDALLPAAGAAKAITSNRRTRLPLHTLNSTTNA